MSRPVLEAEDFELVAALIEAIYECEAVDAAPTEGAARLSPILELHNDELSRELEDRDTAFVGPPSTADDTKIPNKSKNHRNSNHTALLDSCTTP